MSPEELAWFHMVATTYGARLHGDSRGFRTRHHREHVEGDYKNPPPAGQYSDLERRSRESLKQAPVVIPSPMRKVVGLALLERLRALEALVVCISVSGQHAHVLAKMPRSEPRFWMGEAKKHAWFRLRENGWKARLWGKRGKAVPGKDRQHQLNVYRYIMAHARESAWVWTMLSEKQK